MLRRPLLALIVTTLLIGFSSQAALAICQPFNPNNPEGSDVATLTPTQGVYYLPADGSGLEFSYTAQLNSGGISEAPSYGIKLSLYPETGTRISYIDSAGANPVTLSHTFYTPGRYYFVKNLLYYSGTVCTAYFQPDSFRPVCGTTDIGTGIDSAVNLVNYPNCTCNTTSGSPYCMNTLNFISLGSAEQYIEIRDPLPTTPPTLPPTVPPTLPPTTPPTVSPSPTAVPPTLPPTIPPTGPAYWQVYSGLVYGKNGVVSLLPDRSPIYLLNQFPPSMSINDSAGIPLITTGQASAGGNSGMLNQRTFPQNTSFVRKPQPDTLCTDFSFGYFRNKLITPTTQQTGPGAYATLNSLTWNDVPTADATNIAYIDGDLTLNPSAPWIISPGRKYIVLVNGDVDITSGSSIDEQLIQVQPGGFFAVIARGNIDVGYTVGYSAPISVSTPVVPGNLEGMYLAFDSLSIQSIGSTAPDYQFVGSGSFIGCQQINLNRNFATDVANATHPTEIFLYRPDLFASAPSILKNITVHWQEVAE